MPNIGIKQTFTMHAQAIDFGMGDSPIDTGSRLSCRLDGLSSTIREQNRVASLKDLGLLEMDTIPIFDEATQMAARFLESPICILTLMVFDQVWIKSAIGLSRLGLMNRLATDRKLDRLDAFCTYVVDSQQPLLIEDTFSESVFSHSVLTQDYGIRSYVGAPLITAAGQCIGSLSILDLTARRFTNREIEFLCVAARWCMGEFERDYLFKKQAEVLQEFFVLPKSSPPEEAIAPSPPNSLAPTPKKSDFSRSLADLKLKLLDQLVQELRSPLTAVIGMSSVLKGGVFGTLTQKQKDYIEIIHHSGENLNALVEEILKIGAIEEYPTELALMPVNIEMLTQKCINSLSAIAKQKRQEIRLSIDSGKRVWLLDKEKVKQAVYYLLVSIIEASEPGGEIRIHISHRTQTLNISLWMYHPWIGDGLPHVHLQPLIMSDPDHISHSQPSIEFLKESLETEDNNRTNSDNNHQPLTVASLEEIIHQLTHSSDSGEKRPHNLLGLLLGCYLADSHNGKVVLQGTADSGYRYVLILPKRSALEA
jgi:signal transduction histidine kinase